MSNPMGGNSPRMVTAAETPKEQSETRALGLCRLEGQIPFAFYRVRSASSVGSRVDGENVVTEGSHSRMLK